MTTLRLARPDDADAVLRFIAAAGFTPRSPQTWHGLGMGAAIAERDGHLVGAIPFEARRLWTGPAAAVDVLHQTCVAVAPGERGTGLGTRLQNLLADERPGGAAHATVFREDPGSPAYRWYARCGFRPVASIEAWLLETPTAGLPAAVVTPVADVDPATLAAASAGGVGLVDRTWRDVAVWLGVHPYAGRYRFALATREGGAALLGIGRLHSAGERAELLAWSAPSADAARGLAAGVVSWAARSGVAPVRWPMVADDPHAAIAHDLGFGVHWRFDHLAKRLAEDAPPLPTAGWRFEALDYI